MATPEAKTNNSCDESLFVDVEKTKGNNRRNPALDRKRNKTRQPCRYLMDRAVNKGQPAQCAEK